jgi:hypothetical protein
MEMSGECDQFCELKAWCLFDFILFKEKGYCYIYGFIMLFDILFFKMIFIVFSTFFLITSVKSIYDLIVTEIIHRDIPLLKFSWKKLFHALLPLSQII